MVAAVETGVSASSLVSPKGGGMWRYILVRFFLVIPTVFIVVTVVFFLTRITGDPITAREAEEAGLVALVTQDELVVEDALALAAKVAAKSPIALRLAKEAVNAAHEMSRTDALAHERRLFYLLFASEDQKEGMDAFLEKRAPDFTGR